MIEQDDIVVIDIGGPVAPGYNSDCTRTYCFPSRPPTSPRPMRRWKRRKRWRSPRCARA